MNTLATRLKEKMLEQKISVRELSNAVGITYEMARRYTLGTAEPRKDKLEKIAEYLKIEASWLQFGGEEHIAALPAVIDAKHDEDVIVLDVLNIQASAGFGANNGDMMEVVRKIEFNSESFELLYRGINPDNIQIISVKGDSMHPTFAHGDLLMVDVTCERFDGDGVYVFTFADCLYLKRLQRAGKVLRVLSDNAQIYPAWDIQAEEINELFIHGKVKVHQSQQLNFIG